MKDEKKEKDKKNLEYEKEVLVSMAVSKAKIEFFNIVSSMKHDQDKKIEVALSFSIASLVGVLIILIIEII